MSAGRALQQRRKQSHQNDESKPPKKTPPKKHTTQKQHQRQRQPNKVLRANRAALMTSAETFLADPLVEWTKQHKAAAGEVENPMVRVDDDYGGA